MKDVSKTCKGKTVKEFIDLYSKRKEVEIIKAEVEEFCSKFPLPGLDVSQYQRK
jgi:hypothetical protein